MRYFSWIRCYRNIQNFDFKTTNIQKMEVYIIPSAKVEIPLFKTSNWTRMSTWFLAFWTYVLLQSRSNWIEAVAYDKELKETWTDVSTHPTKSMAHELERNTHLRIYASNVCNFNTYFVENMQVNSLFFSFNIIVFKGSSRNDNYWKSKVPTSEIRGFGNWFCWIHGAAFELNVINLNI